MRCAQCYCEVDVKGNTNVFNCSRVKHPEQLDLPEQTEAFVLTESHVNIITETFVKKFRETPNLHTINVKNNSINTIASSMQNLNSVDEIWLSGNPFHCDCSMTWMIHWLSKLSHKSNNTVVRDYRSVKCGTGKFKGIPIHLLTEIAMGCYPHELTRGQKGGIGAAVVLTAILFVVVVMVVKKSKEAKFFTYYLFGVNMIPKDEKTEGLEKKYDAFFCYRFAVFVSC